MTLKPSVRRTFSGASLRALALLTIAVFALEGCATINALSRIGGSKKTQEHVEGKRVSVLALDKPLEADKSLAKLSVTLPAPYLNVEWPQPGGYASHSMANLRGPAQLHRLWKVKVGEGGTIGTREVMGPIVADGKVFTVDTKVRVSAIDAVSGKGLWRTELAISADKPQVGFGGGIAFDAGRLFAVTGFGDVFALDPKTGKILWRQHLTTSFRTPPTALGGRVYVTSSDNQLLVLSQEDGHVLWDYRAIPEEARLMSDASPAVAGDTVVVPFSSGELIAFLNENGQVTWQDSLTHAGRLTSISTLNDIAGSPVIDRGTVYALSHSGRMVAIDLRSGQRIWTDDVAGTEMPWVAGDFLYLVTTEGELLCVYRRDGGIRWITHLKAYKSKKRKKAIVWNGPVMFDGKLLLASSSKRGVVVSPETGEVLQTFKLPGRVLVAPIVANQIVYMLTNDGDLLAYGDSNLRRRANPSRPRTKTVAEPKPGEIPKDDHGLFSPRVPDWVPVF